MMFIDLYVKDYTISGISSAEEAVELFSGLHSGAKFLMLKPAFKCVRLKSGVEFGIGGSMMVEPKTPADGCLLLWLTETDNYHTIDTHTQTDARLVYHLMPERAMLAVAEHRKFRQVFYLYDYDLYLVGIEEVGA